MVGIEPNGGAAADANAVEYRRHPFNAELHAYQVVNRTNVDAVNFVPGASKVSLLIGFEGIKGRIGTRR